MHDPYCKWCDRALVLVDWNGQEPKFVDTSGETLCHPEAGTGPESRQHEPR